MEFLKPGMNVQTDELSIADKLLSLIDCQIPAICLDDESLLEFGIRDGWKLVVFYDCNSFDYIDHFISPEGKVIDFWDWPESYDRQKLVNWSPPSYQEV